MCTSSNVSSCVHHAGFIPSEERVLLIDRLQQMRSLAVDHKYTTCGRIINQPHRPKLVFARSLTDSEDRFPLLNFGQPDESHTLVTSPPTFIQDLMEKVARFLKTEINHALIEYLDNRAAHVPMHSQLAFNANSPGKREQKAPTVYLNLGLTRLLNVVGENDYQLSSGDLLVIPGNVAGKRGMLGSQLR
jgi:hypothetical protein